MARSSNEADRIRGYAAEEYVRPARQSAGGTVRIKAGDIVRGLGLKNKTPNVCTALRSKIFQEQYGVELLEEKGPPSGMSTTVVFTYKLVDRDQAKGTKPKSPSAFDQLRGIAKTLFKNPGDWECSIQRDRRNFYSKTGDPHKSRRG